MAILSKSIEPFYLPHIFSLICGLLPLTLPLGQQFEYESTLITSWSFFTLIFLWPWTKLPPISTSLFSLVWLVLPGALLTLSGTMGCSDGHFLTWSLINTLPAGCLAWGFRSICQPLRFTSRLMALLCAVFSILLTLWIWPQKRMISVFAGFLHGPIYDDWIAGDFTLLFIRSTQASLGLACLALTRNYKTTTAIGFFFWICGVITQSLHPHFNHGHSSLQASLPFVYHEKGWTLHTHNQASLGEAIPHIQFHISELKEWFPDFEHMTIYRYASGDDKKRLFGGHQTDVADVYSPSLHITHLKTLRHELVHTMSAGVAFYGLGFHPYIALTEGLAVALAPHPQALAIHHAAAYLIDSGKVPNPQELFSLGFWSHSGPRAYTVAGSFLLYLANQASKSTVLQLYSGSSLEKLTRKNLKTWLHEWQNFVLQETDLEKAQLLAQRVFREPALWHQTCSHSLRDLQQYKNHSTFFNRMTLPLSYHPDHHKHWKQSFRGPQGQKTKLLQSLRHKPKDFQSAIANIQNIRDRPPIVLEDIRLTLLESDLHLFLGKHVKSKDILKDLLDQTKDWNLGGWKRHILARQLTQNVAWRTYLSGWGAAPQKNDDHWIHAWLKLRSHHALPTKAVQSMQPQKGFEYAWFKTLAERAMKKEQWKQASLFLQQAKPWAPQGHQKWLDQEFRFAKFRQKRSDYQ